LTYRGELILTNFSLSLSLSHSFRCRDEFKHKSSSKLLINKFQLNWSLSNNQSHTLFSNYLINSSINFDAVVYLKIYFRIKKFKLKNSSERQEESWNKIIFHPVCVCNPMLSFWLKFLSRCSRQSAMLLFPSSSSSLFNVV
jgi:hypothetical protein